MSEFALPKDATDPLYNLMYGLSDLADAWPQYREADRKYRGEIDEFSPNFRIEQALLKSAELYKFNLASVPVKVLRNRLKVGGIRVDDGVQSEFDLIWDANDMRVWFPKIITRALKYGDCYVRVWTLPDDTEEDDDLANAGVVISLQHPMTTRVIYDDDSQRRALYAIKYYQDGKRWRADIEYRNRVEHYRTKRDNNKGHKSTDWELYNPPYTKIDANGDPQIEFAEAVEDNPFNEITIKHARTDLPYGCPVHIDAYGPQNAITKLLVTHMSVVDTQGWPARYALTDPAAVLDENNDAPNWGDDADSVTEDGTAPIDGQLRAEPGVTQIMNGIKVTGQYDAADPAAFIDPIELYVALMSVLTETPLYSFKPGGEQPSGKARQIADAPLEAKKETMQALFEGFIRDLVKLVLRASQSSTKTVEVAWKPTVLATDVDDWNVIGLQRTEGVPFEVRMASAGYDSESIAKWLKEKPDMSTQEKIELAGQIAEMMKNLKEAVAANIIDEKNANAILRDVMAKLGFTITKPPEPEPVPSALRGFADATTSGVPVRPDASGAGQSRPGVPPANSGGAPGQTVVVAGQQGGSSAGAGGGKVGG